MSAPATDLMVADAKLDETTALLEYVRGRAANLNLEIRRRDATIAELNTTLGAREAHIADLEAQLAQARTEDAPGEQ